MACLASVCRSLMLSPGGAGWVEVAWLVAAGAFVMLGGPAAHHHRRPTAITQLRRHAVSWRGLVTGRPAWASKSRSRGERKPKIVQQPQLMITEQHHGSQPHQVGLALVPVACLPEPVGDVRDLSAAERVNLRARAHRGPSS